MELAAPILALAVKSNERFFEEGTEHRPEIADRIDGWPEMKELFVAVPDNAKEEDVWKWELANVDLAKYSRVGLPTSESAADATG